MYLNIRNLIIFTTYLAIYVMVSTLSIIMYGSMNKIYEFFTCNETLSVSMRNYIYDRVVYKCINTLFHYRVRYGNYYEV